MRTRASRQLRARLEDAVLFLMTTPTAVRMTKTSGGGGRSGVRAPVLQGGESQDPDPRSAKIALSADQSQESDLKARRNDAGHAQGHGLTEDGLDHEYAMALFQPIL